MPRKQAVQKIDLRRMAWVGLAGEDRGALFFVEFPPSSDGEIAERKGSNAFAEESQAGIADGGNHAADLAVFSFS